MSDIIIWENNDFKILADAFNSMKTNLLFFIEKPEVIFWYYQALLIK